MPKSITRSYSRYTHDATTLLGTLIRSARKERKLTEQELADRAGISRGLLQRIESGNPKCEVGAAFEAAAIVGVQLFDADQSLLAQYRKHTDDKLALLPKSIRKSRKTVNDEF